jgi:hypothetical protein
VGCFVTEAVGATGGLLTVTTALPDMVPGQLFASDAAVRVYVVVIGGLTVNVKGEVRILLTVTGVVPSVYVIDHGGVPVKTTDKLVEPALHCWFAVPLITAVGCGVIVIFLLRTNTGQPPGPSGSFEVSLNTTGPL